MYWIYDFFLHSCFQVLLTDLYAFQLYQEFNDSFTVSCKRESAVIQNYSVIYIQSGRSQNRFTTSQFGFSATRCYIEMVRKVRETHCFIYIKKDKLWLLYVSVGRLPKSDWHMLIRNLCSTVIDLSYEIQDISFALQQRHVVDEHRGRGTVDRWGNLLFLLLDTVAHFKRWHNQYQNLYIVKNLSHEVCLIVR